MARKRMFDNDLINQDEFYDLPMEAKALYFLLGMEADDEGFINPKKVLRLHGGTEDSIKILILKGYLIPFQSGVVVITDWNRNNYLDKNKVKETIYLEEKSQLKYDKKSEKYVLAEGKKIESLTEVKPKLNESLRRIEENRVDSSNSNNKKSEDSEVEFIKIFETIEKEFGRTISPLEIEMIKTWDYPYEILKLAVQEASTSGNFSIKYIDRIVFNWKKANVKSVADVKRYIADFKEKKERRKSNNQPKKQAETIGTDYGSYEVIYEEF